MLLMGQRERRRRGSTAKPTTTPTPQRGEHGQDNENQPVAEAAEQEGDMGNNDYRKPADDKTEHEPVAKVEAPAPAPAPAAEKLYAVTRFRYKSGGKIVTAEPGDEVVNPNPKDLQDALEHGCVESFSEGQLQALLSLKGKDVATTQRLAKTLGIL